MLIALVVFNVVHPGRIMPGKESDFPKRKERKHYFEARSSESNLQVLRTSQPAGPAFMPEEIAVRPKTQEAIPSYGYVR